MAKPKEALLGKCLWDVFPDVKGTLFETNFHKVMTERAPVSFEIYYLSYDMWLEIRTHAHDDGIVLFYTDISQHKKNEERIQSFNNELEQKVKERTCELETVNKSSNHSATRSRTICDHRFASPMDTRAYCSKITRGNLTRKQIDWEAAFYFNL